MNGGENQGVEPSRPTTVERTKNQGGRVNIAIRIGPSQGQGSRAQKDGGDCVGLCLEVQRIRRKRTGPEEGGGGKSFKRAGAIVTMSRKGEPPSRCRNKEGGRGTKDLGEERTLVTVSCRDKGSRQLQRKKKKKKKGLENAVSTKRECVVQRHRIRLVIRKKNLGCTHADFEKTPPGREGGGRRNEGDHRCITITEKRKKAKFALGEEGGGGFKTLRNGKMGQCREQGVGQRKRGN